MFFVQGAPIACKVTQIVGKCNHAHLFRTPILHHESTICSFGAPGGLQTVIPVIMSWSRRQSSIDGLPTYGIAAGFLAWSSAATTRAIAERARNCAAGALGVRSEEAAN